MQKKILVGALVAAVLTLGVVGLGRAPAYAEDGGKNLKILKGMNKADLKKVMKGISGALGVQCDHCHDTDDFSKDNEKKEVARKMMEMSMGINNDFFKGERRVTCVTCHAGKTTPKR